VVRGSHSLTATVAEQQQKGEGQPAGWSEK